MINDFHWIASGQGIVSSKVLKFNSTSNTRLVSLVEFPVNPMTLITFIGGGTFGRTDFHSPVKVWQMIKVHQDKDCKNLLNLKKKIQRTLSSSRSWLNKRINWQWRPVGNGLGAVFLRRWTRRPTALLLCMEYCGLYHKLNRIDFGEMRERKKEKKKGQRMLFYISSDDIMFSIINTSWSRFFFAIL